jgi:hypothetical protein
MRYESVLPVGYFVQIPGRFQIKFTWSVADTLHRPNRKPAPGHGPELEQGIFLRDRPTAHF